MEDGEKREKRDLGRVRRFYGWIQAKIAFLYLRWLMWRMR